MSNVIRENASLDIKFKVLSVEDIMGLISIALHSCSEVSGIKQTEKPKCTLECEDRKGMFYCENAEIIRDFLQNERVTRVVVEFGLRGYGDASLSIALNEGQESGYDRNRVVVEGVNSTWVKGTLARIKEQLGYVENQIHWFWESNVVIQLIIFTITNGLFVWIAYKVLVLASYKYNSSVLITAALVIICGMVISGKIASYISNSLKEIWPIVELNTGREIQQRSKIKRTKIYTVLFTILFPILLEISVNWFFSSGQNNDDSNLKAKSEKGKK